MRYPYLLRKLPITHVNQVWSADITYVPLLRGFKLLNRRGKEASLTDRKFPSTIAVSDNKLIPRLFFVFFHYTKGLKDGYNKQGDVLEVESRFYEDHRAEFVEKHPDRFLLIHGECLIDHFETMDEALDEGVRLFGSGPFMVRQSGADEPQFATHLLMLAG